jgi:hypothetical protein
MATVTASIINAIKGRKFSGMSRLFTNPCDFQAWNPSGHWVAEDGTTAARIIEVWFSPGSNSTVTWSNETSGARGAATLELEVTWKAPPDDQIRVLRQAWLLTVKGDKIATARVYCAGLHMDFPEVDLEKQRRTKGLIASKQPPANARIAPSIRS